MSEFVGCRGEMQVFSRGLKDIWAAGIKISKYVRPHRRHHPLYDKTGSSEEE